MPTFGGSAGPYASGTVLVGRPQTASLCPPFNTVLPRFKAAPPVIFNVTLQTSTTPSPSLSRSTVKALRTTSTPSPSLFKSIGKPVLGQSTPSPSLVRSIGKLVLGSTTPAPSLTKAVGKTLLTTTTPAPSLFKTIAKSIQAVTGGIASGGLSGPRVTMMFFRG